MSDRSDPGANRQALARAGDSRHPAFLRLARRYTRRRISRRLDGLWVSGLDQTRAALAERPLILAANVVLRLIMAARHGHSMLSVLVHPLAVLAMMGVLFDSYRCSRRGDIRWRGRSYAARATREAA